MMFSSDYRPARRNHAGLKCGTCRRVFAAGHVPAPLPDGSLICRDCRAEQAQRLDAAGLFPDVWREP